MQPDNAPPADPLGQLAASARGWHRIQLAVLGFVGFCGVMWVSGDPSGPSWLQWLAGALVALALVLACLAVFLVGRVAHPFHGPAVEAGIAQAPSLASGTRQLRTGIRLSYLAVATLAVATLSGWWPTPATGGAVQVSDVAGRSWCGELTEAPPGVVRIDTGDEQVTVPAARIATLRPAGTC
ncbi:MAG: hypothetical protein ACRDT2_13555 [Natronosporangium sp.]